MTKERMKEIMREITQKCHDFNEIVDVMEEQYEEAKRQEDKPLLKTMLGSDGENDTYSFEEAIEIAINRWDQIGTVEQAAVALYLAGIPQNSMYVSALLSSGISK